MTTNKTKNVSATITFSHQFHNHKHRMNKEIIKLKPFLQKLTSNNEFSSFSEIRRCSAGPVASVSDFNAMNDEWHQDAILFSLPFHEHPAILGRSLLDYLVRGGVPLNSILKRFYNVLIFALFKNGLNSKATRPMTDDLWLRPLYFCIKKY